MRILVVVENPDDWPLDVEGVTVMSAREYIDSETYRDLRRARVFNLCRSYRYQRAGYYVSLLAEARGHRPMPDVGTIQDLKSATVLRVAASEVEELVHKSLADIQSDTFTLSVYFGRNVAQRHDRLAHALFQQFPAPFMRASFDRNPKTREWGLDSIESIAAGQIPESHMPFVHKVTEEYFAARPRKRREAKSSRYDLAILHDPDETEPPSNERALKRFVKAGAHVGLEVTIIDRTESGRLGEYDALFLRETTAVNHRTFRLARRAHALGLVVIDDHMSILKCTNKVYLAELLERHKVPAPKTVIVSKDSIGDIAGTIGFPCILKQPDSSFSKGVVKADNTEELQKEIEPLLAKSDLVLAQEFLPTDFDWRIGVLDKKPLYACRYFMAPEHWQIYKRDGGGKLKDVGNADTVTLDQVPPKVLDAAVRAAALIGNGLYGVDVKQSGERPYVIEVNDNPNIDAGVEDDVLGEDLYLRIMTWFLEQIRERRGETGSA